MGIEALEGKIITEIRVENDDRVEFACADGSEYRMHHQQDCCEDVWLAEVIGSWDDLLGVPLSIAYEETESDREPIRNDGGSATWTFYTLRTSKGTVVLRWVGESNGYYSESVDFTCVKEGSAERGA